MARLCPVFILVWATASVVASEDLLQLILDSGGKDINLTNGENYTVRSPTPLLVESDILLAGFPMARGPQMPPPTVDMSSAGSPVFEFLNHSSLELRDVHIRMRLDLSSARGKDPFEVRKVLLLLQVGA